ncbi:2-phospho-L-lactate guanylyltransferase [Pseudarthrobacter siccitolerans]
MLNSSWTLVLPIKGSAQAKSRLGRFTSLAPAIALDTVAAASGVAEVIVVMPLRPAFGFEPDVFEKLGATLVDDRGHGLNDAVLQGLRLSTSRGTYATGVLLGDLPTLTSDELREALELARQQPMSMVPDSTGTGTTLLAALSPREHRPQFGAGSRLAHNAAGYVELEIDPLSGLRNDLDTVDDLLRLRPRLGPHTSYVLAELEAEGCLDYLVRLG